jgi:hypothetical protein
MLAKALFQVAKEHSEGLVDDAYGISRSDGLR